MTQKSNCCGSELKTHCEDEGTCYYSCMKCGKACDPVTKQNDKEEKWKAQFGVTIFTNGIKEKEITFKTEKEMAYWLYQNNKNYIQP